MTRFPATVLATVLGTLPLAGFAPGAVPRPADAPVPHRAVYAISLADSETKSGVASASGRMVFEVTGSPCEGYTMTQRLVVKLFGEESEDKLLDYRVSTFEAGDGKQFRFVSQTYVDDRMTDEVKGTAERSAEGVRVRIDGPGGKIVRLDQAILFPSQHLKALLAAARTDRRFLSHELYEGAGKGDSADTATAVIGTPRPAEPASGTADGAALTLGKTSWPVTVAYFSRGRSAEPQAGEETPTYQMSFRLFENGVSRDLRMDYGDYALAGALESLEPLPAAEACPTH